MLGFHAWSSPASVPVIIYITWSPNLSRPDVQTTSAIGGVKIDVPPPGPGVCVYRCDDNIPTNQNAKSVDGLPAVRTGPLGNGPVDAYLRTRALFGGDPEPPGPIRVKQLPSLACLAAAAAGLPGLGTLTPPRILNDPNTLVKSLLNSTFDGGAEYDADCEARIEGLWEVKRSAPIRNC